MAYSWEQHLGNAAKSLVELATSPFEPLFNALTPSFDSREPYNKNLETISEPTSIKESSEHEKNIISLDILKMARGAVSNGVSLSYNNASEDKFGTMKNNTPLNVVAERTLQSQTENVLS